MTKSGIQRRHLVTAISKAMTIFAKLRTLRINGSQVSIIDKFYKNLIAYNAFNSALLFIL